MTSEQAHGHCLCRTVQYLVVGKPLWCGHCHCNSCRRITGSAVATFVAYDKKQFSIIAGQLGTYESSPGVTRSFCRKCGTPVAYESKKVEGEIHLYVGTLESPEKYKPQFHVFCEEQLPWLNISDKTPRYDTLP